MSDINKFFDKLMTQLIRVEGKIIGEDNDMIKDKLAESNRGAWVNHATEQYLKKETVDVIPEKFEVGVNDVISEIAKREIEKILGT